MRACRVCGVAIKGNRFNCPAHNPMRDPAWRSERARRAAQEGNNLRRARIRKRVLGMDPVAAYILGCKNGYNRAYDVWQAWARNGAKV